MLRTLREGSAANGASASSFSLQHNMLQRVSISGCPCWASCLFAARLISSSVTHAAISDKIEHSGNETRHQKDHRNTGQEHGTQASEPISTN